MFFKLAASVVSSSPEFCGLSVDSEPATFFKDMVFSCCNCYLLRERSSFHLHRRVVHTFYEAVVRKRKWPYFGGRDLMA